MVRRPSLSDIEDKERRQERFLLRLPYPLLAAATVASLIQPDHDGATRLRIIGTVAITTGWMLGMHGLRSSRWRHREVPMIVYFAGILVCSALLMWQDRLFFIYAVTGFLLPFMLMPRWLGILGVLGNSFVINMPLSDVTEAKTLTDLTGFVLLVTVQTLFIGVFGYFATTLQGERKQAARALEETMQENAGLHAQLLTQAREAGVLDERQRLAGEIHDTLAQGLAGIVTQLEAAQQAGDRTTERDRHLDTATRLARTSLDQARRTVHAVGPDALEDAQLPEALGQAIADWSELSGPRTEFTVTGTPQRLHPEIEVTVLRVVQEGLANIAKHAGANRVGLTLSYMGDVVTIDVRDDGVGFDPSAAAGGDHELGGFGLTGMRQRLRRVAGTLEVESEPGGGTALSASVPLIRFEGDR